MPPVLIKYNKRHGTQMWMHGNSVLLFNINKKIKEIELKFPYSSFTQMSQLLTWKNVKSNEKNTHTHKQRNIAIKSWE